MERRKFVIGLGSLAAGGAAATGTGAFSSVTADRDLEVDLETDENAYLRLTPGQENGEYVQTTGGTSPNGVLMIEMNGQSAQPGSGINAKAVSTFDDLFRIQNQADDKKEVWITADYSDLPTGMSASDISFYDSSNGNIEGPNNTVELTVGQALHVGIEFDTTGIQDSTDVSSVGHIMENITVHAENV